MAPRPRAPRSAGLTPGQNWRSRVGNSKFVVLKPETPGELLVEVTRRWISRDGEVKEEARKRTVRPEVLPMFLQSYELED